MPFLYSVYGLSVSVTRPLESLTRSYDGSVDISVNLSNTPLETASPIIGWTKTYPKIEDRFSMQVERCTNWVKLSFPRSQDETLRFYIRSDGKYIYSQKPDSIPESDIEPFLLGPVLGAAIRLLGKTCLHASVLSINGKAFALTGVKRAGKSTTAAALLEKGAKLVADDVAVLDLSNSKKIRVESAYPGLRLMPNALEGLGYSADQFPSLISMGEKRFISFKNDHVRWQFDQNKPELVAVYSFLQRDTELNTVSIDTLSPQKAMMAIAPHSYAHFMLDKTELKTEFPRLAQITRTISVKSIQCPDNIDCLSDIAEDILNDVNNIQLEDATL